MKDLKRYVVKPGQRIDWRRIDPDETGTLATKERALSQTDRFARELDCWQERLYAERTRSLLIVLQGMDTSGKDGTIRHVMNGINPQGCVVTSFKEPSREELSHDFLWRIHARVPARGYIGIFNRSHYEDVLITRVHGLISDREAKRRDQEIVAFERELVRGDTTILKFFLAISRDEQRQRLEDRLDDPDKRWKFSGNDLTERKYWDKYQQAYAKAIAATSTREAPWIIVPSNHKWYRNYVVARVIARTLKGLHPRYPEPEGTDPRRIKIPR